MWGHKQWQETLIFQLSMETNNRTNTNPSDAEVAEWTKQYGKLRVITVTLEDENENGEPLPCLRFYFKRNIQNKIATLTLANKKLQENKDAFAYSKIILNAFAVNGQEVFSTHEDALIAMMPYVDGLITTATAQLGK